MFIKLKKEFLLKYLFLLVLFFSCAAGVSSTAFILVNAIMLCGVAMTSGYFSHGEETGVKNEGIVLDLIMRFTLCGVAVVCIGISAGLTAWYSIVIYSVYGFCLALKLCARAAHDIKREGEKPVEYVKNIQEAAVTLLVPASYLFAAISHTVFEVIYYVILGLAAFSYLLRLRVKRPSSKVMIGFAIAEGVILTVTLVFTLTGLFTA